MTRNEISKILESHQKEMAGITEPEAKQVVSVLLNLVETLVSEDSALREENQNLKDEISRLKGEQGKPQIKANKNKTGDISSEQERKEAECLEEEDVQREGFRLDKGSLDKLKERQIPDEILERLDKLSGQRYSSKAEFVRAVESQIGDELTRRYSSLLIKYARYKKRNRKPKKPEICIDREQICPVDTTELPEDAKFNGHEEKVVQDVIIKTDNVKFKREIYYSPTQKKTYLASVPRGYEGEFGPHINAQIVVFKYVNNMSIPKIAEFFGSVGTIISNSYVSDRLTKHLEVFHLEKSEIYQASLESSGYQQIDDTASRVDGQNCHTHIVCNPFATLFFTTQRKDRLTILDVLRNFESRQFLFNEETFELLAKLKVPKKVLAELQEVERDKAFSEQQMQEILGGILPDPSRGKLHRTRIMEAAAIACYHHQSGVPIVEVLVCDDAPQFKLLTDELGLCWVHEGRHYKRLNPLVPVHQEQLRTFRKHYWEYYHKLYKYKHHPSSELARALSEEFDSLFSTTTGYDELDERIAKSKAKKAELLTVLAHPEIPLHNNLSENGARVQKRRQDVSLHTKTEEGTRAKDTMMSIVETCKKLGVSAYHYIYDRISQTFNMPSLAELIRAKTVPKPIPEDSA
jgi:hypothetical protein